MLQSILLSALPWGLLLWPVWALGCAIRWKGNWYAYSIVPLFGVGIPQCESPKQGQGVDVLVANVNAFTGHTERLEERILALSADVVVLIEKRLEKIEGMKRVADDFQVKVPRPSHHMAVFCKEDCQAWVSPQIGSKTMAMSVALVRIEKGICLVAVHAPPPVPYDASGMEPYISFIVKHLENGRVRQDWQVCKAGDAAVVMGDLNAVPYSRPYRRLLQAGLSDRRKWTGIWGNSWPVNGMFHMPIPVFRLDHVLAGPAETLGVHSVAIPDSDHYAIRASLRSDSTGR